MRYLGVLLLAIAGWPSVAWYVARMGDGSDEPWGVLALLGAVLFSVLGRKESMSSWRYLAAAACLAIPLILASVLTPLLVSLFLFLAVACLLVDRRCWLGHAGLFVLALPLISSLQFYGGYPLRWVIGKLSSGFLALFGYRVEVQGTVMKWRGEIIVIDAPCSGVQMLWGSAFLACVLICIQRTDFRRSLFILQMASVSAFLGNVARNVLLFFLESGLVASARWAHDAVGLAVFAAVMAVIVWAGGRAGGRRFANRILGEVQEAGRFAILNPIVFFFILFVYAFLRQDPVQGLPEGVVVEGVIIDQVRDELKREGWLEARLDAKALAYAKGFPGTIEIYGKEDRSLVIRVIHRATRRYHLSADCYRAIGYSIEPMPILRTLDGSMWGRALATRDGEEVEVRERIVSLDGQSWTDPSSWFWSAMLGRSQGPWVGYSESVLLMK